MATNVHVKAVPSQMPQTPTDGIMVRGLGKAMRPVISHAPEIRE